MKSDRFTSWFPKRVRARNTWGGELYLEQFARCDRLKNSPLFHMRRRLNGKEGKAISERNAERRTGDVRTFVPRKRPRLGGLPED